MRKPTWLLFSCLITVSAAVFCLSSCLKDKVTESLGHDSISTTYRISTPVYVTKSNVLAAINGPVGQSIINPGQLYIKGSYIYLNDVNLGIHIIDNSNPANPVQKAFLSIPGNRNIAIRQILYADMYADLLAIDISNPSKVKVQGTLFDAFPSRNTWGDTARLIASWDVRDTTVRQKASGDPLGNMYPVPGTGIYTLDYTAVPAAAAYYNSSSGGGGTGTAGSTAPMALVGDYIYAVPEPHTLGVIGISDPTHPAFVNSIYAGYDLETVFPMQDKLLLGSMEGVYVYSLSNAEQPTKIGEFSHGKACDPVIADANFAYVTLRSGSYCGGAANELDVISAKDLTSTSLLKTYSMTGPSGLSKDGSLLFVCDSNVVRTLLTSDGLNFAEVTQLKVTSAHDAIASNHLLIVVAADGLYEFDYSDLNNIKQLSYLATK